MRRVPTAVVALVALLAGLGGAAPPSGAQGEVLTTFFQGVGPSPLTAMFYLGPPDASEWTMAAPIVEHTWLVTVREVPPGSYNVLACTHLGVPPTTVTGCPDGSSALNGNAGTNVTLPSGGTIALVYGGPGEPLEGRPVVIVFPRDTGCIPDGQARLEFDHGALVGPVDIVVDGDVVFDGFSWGDSASLDLRAVNHEVEVRLDSDDSTLLGPVVLDSSPAGIRYISIVGNPGAEAAYRLVYNNGTEGTACSPETTSTASTSTTIEVADPPPPAPPQAQPADFTG
jgi:hypothetical protein